MSFEGAPGDRLAIRERIEAYADAVFRRDAEAWIANWDEDAVWSLPGLTVSGRASIRSAWEAAMEGFPMAAFFATPGSIVVQGDVAAARTYTREILVLADGGVRRIVGAYDDRLVRRNGEWLFSHRAYQILHDES